MIATQDRHFFLRAATEADAGLMLHFMKKLGAYQQMEDQISATEDSLRALIANGQGEAMFGRYDAATVAFMFFNQTSSAFTGRSGLFIDAFYVDETMRDRGLGRIMMDYLSGLAIARGGQMLEWGCLDWNTPTIGFYRGMGAYCLDTMRVYRLSPDDMRISAKRF